MKKILEVIHPNTAIRTFGTTVNIPGVDNYLSVYSTETELPEAAKAIVAALWEVPAVKNLSLSRGEIRVEVSEAWEDEWQHVSPQILEIINKALFDGEATCCVRDDAARYNERSHWDDEY